MIMDNIEKHLDINLKEISIEVNPEDINKSFIGFLNRAGVSRVSIGIQQLDERLLNLLGRRHSLSDIYTATEILKNGDFILNFDFIVGIPSETEYEIEKIIDFIRKYNPDSVSVYILEDVRGKYWQNMKKLKDENKINHFELIEKILESIGVRRYEISNFAKDGKVSVHNLKYWNYEEFLGIGPSAASLLNKRRWKNSDSFDLWEENVLKNGNYGKEEINLTDSDMVMEAIMMGLRKTEGINMSDFKKRFRFDPLNILQKVLKEKKQFFEIKNGYIKIKKRYLFVFNSLLAELFN
jgi:oxygen-independent coproporphyrinogen-3 oxidase